MIEQNLFIVVADGQRAHVYRNSGTAQAPRLELVTSHTQNNPRSHEQGTDKAGTAFSGPGGTRSHVSETDYHAEQERAFAKEIIDSVNNLMRDRSIKSLIWVAPPRMLHDLRHAMPHQLKDVTIREIDKDLTKHQPHEIVKLIFD